MLVATMVHPSIPSPPFGDATGLLYSSHNMVYNSLFFQKHAIFETAVRVSLRLDDGQGMKSVVGANNQKKQMQVGADDR